MSEDNIVFIFLPVVVLLGAIFVACVLCRPPSREAKTMKKRAIQSSTNVMTANGVLKRALGEEQRREMELEDALETADLVPPHVV